MLVRGHASTYQHFHQQLIENKRKWNEEKTTADTMCLRWSKVFFLKKKMYYRDLSRTVPQQNTKQNKVYMLEFKGFHCGPVTWILTLSTEATVSITNIKKHYDASVQEVTKFPGCP